MADEVQAAGQDPNPRRIPGTQFLKQLQLPPTLCTRSNSIQSMVSVNDGDYLWACCNEGTIVVWDTKTGAVQGTRQAHKATIFDLVCVSNAHNPFAREKNTVWAACMDSTVTVWNTSLCLLRKLTLGSSSATSLIQVGELVYIADAKQIFTFDSQTYDLIAVMDLPRLDWLVSGKPGDGTSNNTGDSSTSASAGEQSDSLRAAPSVLHLPSSATSAPRPSSLDESPGFSGYFVRSMALVNRHIWVCTDGFVCFIDTNPTSRTVVPEVYISVPKINSVIHIASVKQVWGACSDSNIYIWDADAPNQKGEIQPLKRLQGWTSDRVSRLVNFEDKFIYCATWDKRMRVWDAQTAELLFESPRPHECPIMAICVLPYKWLRVYPKHPKLQPQANQYGSTGSNSSTNNSLPAASAAIPMSASSNSLQSQNNANAMPTPMITSSSQFDRRITHSLPPPNSNPSSQSSPATFETHLPRNPSTEFNQNSFEGQEPYEMTIMSVFTADWSTVSHWL